MALRVAKQVLRKEIKNRLASLSEEEKIRQSKIVTAKVCEFMTVICVLLRFNGKNAQNIFPWAIIW